MAKIAQGTIHKFTTGEFVDADTAPQGGALNPIFEIIRLALNDTDGRVDNVYTKTESDNKYIANASGLQSAFTNTAPSPVTLNYGQQVLTMAETAPLQNLKLQGRTLVNAMGRRGNCESLLDWGASGNHTATLDTTTFTQGSASYKLVATGAGSGSNGLSSTTGILNIKDDADYLLIMNLKALSGTPTVHSELWGTIGTKLANVVDTNWKTYVFKVKSSSAGQLKQLFIWLTAAGTVYVDAIRLYEVTGSMLTETDTMTSDQINAKYPYVDDMKSIANPYAIKYGENLLAPFIEWSSIDSNAQRVVVDAYNFTVKGKTTGSFAGYDFRLPVTGGQTYTLAAPVTIANIGGIIGVGAYYNLTPYDSQGNALTNLDSAPYATANGTTVLGKTFTVPANAVSLKVVLSTQDTVTGDFTFDKPVLNIGSTAITFKPKNDDYLFFPNVQLASSLDGTIYDTLSQRDGKYFKLSRYKTMDLDGSLGWVFHGDGVGYKQVRVDNLYTNPQSKNAVKYDGKILAITSNATSADTVYHNLADAPSFNNLYITIADTDSGWGETYTPTSAEIQAYFNGWKMYDNGADFTAKYSTGTKAWCYRADGARGVSSGDYTGGTNTLPTTIAPNFKPYKLQYQLAASAVEEVQVEGAITLHEGLNHIEVGNGIIVREKAPLDVTSNGQINRSSTPLKNRTNRLLAVYKNSLIDSGNWVILTGDPLGNGGSRATPKTLIDVPTNQNLYETTYIAEQSGITCNLLQITAEYPTNIKTTIDQLAINQADMTTRIGVLENTKAAKAQPQWIVPTLLNSWVVLSTVGYYKDEFGFVHLRGSIRNGTVTSGTVILYLPPKFRPSQSVFIPVICSNGTSYVAGRLNLGAGGDLQTDTVSNTSLLLDGISFLAEQ